MQPHKENINRELLSGIGFTAVAKYTGLIFSIAVTCILARLLSPEDFGIIAIAMIFISFFSTLSIMGISPAIVQNLTLEEDDLVNIYSFTFYLAALLALLLIAFTPLIGWFYDNFTLTIVLALLSVNVFFGIINVVPNALALKKRDFKFIAIRTLVVQICMGVAAIAAALLGGKIYSLLITPILGSILIYFLTVSRYSVALRKSFSLHSIRKIFHFSLYQIFFNVSNLLYRNIDKLLIGKFFNISLLGYYEKSYHLILMPIDNVANVISPVLHPVLAVHQHDLDFIVKKYLQIVKVLAYWGFAISVLFYFFASEIVLILLGDKWIESIVILKIFSWAIGILIVQSVVGPIYQVTNNTKGMFKASLFALFFTVAACIVGICSKSLENIAVAVVISFYLSFFFYHEILFRESLSRPVRQFFRPLGMPLLTAAGLFAYFTVICYFLKFDHIFVSAVVKGLLAAPWGLFIAVKTYKIMKSKVV